MIWEAPFCPKKNRSLKHPEPETFPNQCQIGPVTSDDLVLVTIGLKTDRAFAPHDLR